MIHTLNKKALDHVTNQLKNIDSYAAYSAMSDFLQKLGIAQKEKSEIMAEFSLKLNEILKPVRDCAEWTKAISESLNESA